jgi:hypothetical protein
MSFTSTTIPTQRRESTAAKIAPEDMKQIQAMLANGQVVTDDTVYSEPSKSGKMDARTVAYYAGYAVREAVLQANDKLTGKDLSLRTWEDEQTEGGFRWGLRIK